jgi:hypothetical protein
MYTHYSKSYFYKRKYKIMKRKYKIIMPDTIFLILVEGFLIVSILIGGILSPWQTLELYRNGVSTQGIIISRTPCDPGGDGNPVPSWILKIAYTDRTGRSYTLLRDCNARLVTTVGSPIAVCYLPDSPNTADLEENVATGFGTSIMEIVISCILLGFALVSSYKRFIVKLVSQWTKFKG